MPSAANAAVQKEPGAFLAGPHVLGFGGQRQLLPRPSSHLLQHRGAVGLSQVGWQGAELLGDSVNLNYRPLTL